MGIDLAQIRCDSLSSSSSSTKIFCDEDFNRCSPCRPSCGCRYFILNDHSYSTLKRICHKIIKNYNRDLCREKYSCFEGGNSIRECLEEDGGEAREKGMDAKANYRKGSFGPAGSRRSEFLKGKTDMRTDGKRLSKESGKRSSMKMGGAKGKSTNGVESKSGKEGYSTNKSLARKDMADQKSRQQKTTKERTNGDTTAQNSKKSGKVKKGGRTSNASNEGTEGRSPAKKMKTTDGGNDKKTSGNKANKASTEASEKGASGKKAAKGAGDGPETAAKKVGRPQNEVSEKESAVKKAVNSASAEKDASQSKSEKVSKKDVDKGSAAEKIQKSAESAGKESTHGKSEKVSKKLDDKESSGNKVAKSADGVGDKQTAGNKPDSDDGSGDKEATANKTKGKIGSSAVTGNDKEAANRKLGKAAGEEIDKKTGRGLTAAVDKTDKKQMNNKRMSRLSSVDLTGNVKKSHRGDKTKTGDTKGDTGSNEEGMPKKSSGIGEPRRRQRGAKGSKFMHRGRRSDGYQWPSRSDEVRACDVMRVQLEERDLSRFVPCNPCNPCQPCGPCMLCLPRIC